MKINLSRPLAFFDLETTGTNIATDRIVEISILKILPDQTKEVYTKRVNPTVLIPAQASEVHGIYDKDVAAEPSFEYLAQEVYDFLDDCDLAGFNSNRFDVPLLIEEFLRVNDSFDLSDRKFVDVQTIYHKLEPRNLSAAYRNYCGKTLENAHSAEADVLATYEVLEAQLDKYEELENDIDYLSEFSRHVNKAKDFAGRIGSDENGEAIFNFGKHKGKTLEHVFEVEPSYYSWIMNAEFPLYTKKVVRDVYQVMQARKMSSE